AVQLGHDPIQQSQTWPISAKERVFCQHAVFDGSNFVACALQSLLQEPPRHRVIVCNQNPHEATPARHAVISAVTWSKRCSSTERCTANSVLFPSRANSSRSAAEAAAGLAERFKSMPFNVCASDATLRASRDATAACRFFRCRGASSLKRS